MARDTFKEVALFENHPNYETCIKRSGHLYHRNDDIRSPFARDYNRILHCTAYRRLKHKTQVFFATTNDHICTRMEHVNHVTAVSYTIAKYLGLNTELTNAIALGHDLGHAPFGHAGETFIKTIVENEMGETFWHEKNSLRFVDDCETLEDPGGNHRNLNLTYGVRDGIISHCGEVYKNGIIPRNESIDLKSIRRPSEYQPYTWEGCVVKVADTIAYLGRDIEDALSLKLLTRSDIRNLSKAVRPYTEVPLGKLNTTAIMHGFIVDICDCSSVQKGICLAAKNYDLMKALKEFNNKNIYNHWKIENYKQYAELIISSIYNMCKRFYRKDKTIDEVCRYLNVYPILSQVFQDWLVKYSDVQERDNKFKNRLLYNLSSENDYKRSIVDFISGMTDSFAIKIFNEVIMF
jgi:dGTPase